jgi:hypothetical protein
MFVEHTEGAFLRIKEGGSATFIPLGDCYIRKVKWSPSLKTHVSDPSGLRRCALEVFDLGSSQIKILELPGGALKPLGTLERTCGDPKSFVVRLDRQGLKDWTAAKVRDVTALDVDAISRQTRIDPKDLLPTWEPDTDEPMRQQHLDDVPF